MVVLSYVISLAAVLGEREILHGDSAWNAAYQSRGEGVLSCVGCRRVSPGKTVRYFVAEQIYRGRLSNLEKQRHPYADTKTTYVTRGSLQIALCFECQTQYLRPRRRIASLLLALGLLLAAGGILILHAEGLVLESWAAAGFVACMLLAPGSTWVAKEVWPKSDEPFRARARDGVQDQYGRPPRGRIGPVEILTEERHLAMEHDGVIRA